MLLSLPESLSGTLVGDGVPVTDGVCEAPGFGVRSGFGPAVLEGFGVPDGPVVEPGFCVAESPDVEFGLRVAADDMVLLVPLVITSFFFTTVTLHIRDFLPIFALIFAFPAFFPVTTPFFDTVAIRLEVVDHTTFLPCLFLILSLYFSLIRMVTFLLEIAGCFALDARHGAVVMTNEAASILHVITVFA